MAMKFLNGAGTRLNQGARQVWDFVDRRILVQSEAPGLQLPSLPRRTRLLEWLVVALVVLAYCLPFLNLGSLSRLEGNESEVFQSLDQVLNIGVRQYGQIPLWNPYIDSGIPYVADPMLHTYNPFISLPVLILGTLNGFKIAMFLGFLIAAFGAWYLGRLLRLGTAGRLWMAILYALAGATMARFFQGQYLLTLAGGWIPWVVATLYAAIMTRRRLHVALAAVCLALLFMCGNVYYAYYSLFALGLLTLVMVVRVHSGRPWIGLNLGLLQTTLAVAVLALGLIAIQLLPLAEFWPRISKATNITLTDSQTPEQVLLDFTSTDPRRADAVSSLPPEEFYGYIGWMALAPLVLLPFAWKKANNRPLVYFAVLVAFSIVWIDMRDTPLKEVYQKFAFLYQFRYPTRMLIFATLALAGLTGLALDRVVLMLWQRARSTTNRVLGTTTLVVMGGLGVFAVVALGQVFSTNRYHLGTQDYYAPPYEAFAWLRQHDPGIYYVSAPNGWHNAALAYRMRYLDAWYPFNDVRRFDGAINRTQVQAAPKYKILGSDSPAPVGANLIQTVSGFDIYELPQSLPFAFSATTSDLLNSPANAQGLAANSVTPLDPYEPNLNSFEFIAQGASGQTLVVLSALVPGWRLTVDDQPAELLNVSGYMAASVLPGTHHYVFQYAPGSFSLGLVLSLIFLFVAAAFVAGDLEPIPALGELSVPAFAGSVAAWWRRGPASSLLSKGRILTATGTYAQDIGRVGSATQLPDGARVTVALAAEGVSPWEWWLQASARMLDAWLSKITWQGLFFTAGLVVYVAVGLYRISDFPIYFFGDEAIQTTSAADLVSRGFRGPDGQFLPTFFVNGSYYNLGASIYLQTIPSLLFRRSIDVTRGTAFLSTLLAAVGLALILRNAFKSPYWWTAPLLLGVVPAWFLHSRTAFETVLFASVYTLFLYFYLEYRNAKPARLFPALVAAAVAFYSYSPGQFITVLTGVILLAVDWRYHWQNRRVWPAALALSMILAIPYGRFRLTHTFSPVDQLRILGSYWLQPIPFGTKLADLLREYTYGLSPTYWYLPNGHDIVRHIMKGYGHILLGTLPFMLAGVILSIRRIRGPAYRVALIALLVAPSGAALADIGITRALVFIIPATLLTAVGLSWFLELLLPWLSTHANTLAAILKPVIPAALLIGLSVYRIGMLNDALINGPTWYTDYGLYGMQYGAKQVFEDNIKPALQSTDANFYVSPVWANGATNLSQFFFTPAEQKRVQLLGIGTYTSQEMAFSPNDVFVLTADDYHHLVSGGLFKKIDIQGVINYPDGTPGFYFVHLAYVDNIDTVFAQQQEILAEPAKASFVIQGHQADLLYSKIESGQPQDMFDGDLNTLVRGVEANPFIVDATFQEPFLMGGLTGDFGHMKMTLRADVYVQGSTAPLTFGAQDLTAPGEPHIVLNFSGGPYEVTRIHIEITNLDVSTGATAKIHVRDIDFQP